MMVNQMTSKRKQLILVSILAVVLLVMAIFHQDITTLLTGKRIESKVFKSKSGNHQVFVMLYTANALSFNYYTNIYVLPEKASRRKLPENDCYIKYSSGTDVSVQWLNENTVLLTSDRMPIHNNLCVDYEVQIKVDDDLAEKHLNSKKAENLIRYSF